MSFPMDINSTEESLSVTSTSNRVEVGTGKRVIIKNTSTVYGGYFKSGDATITATTGDTWVGPGVEATYGMQDSHTHVAGICASGQSLTARIMRGNGD